MRPQVGVVAGVQGQSRNQRQSHCEERRHNARAVGECLVGALVNLVQQCGQNEIEAGIYIALAWLQRRAADDLGGHCLQNRAVNPGDRGQFPSVPGIEPLLDERFGDGLLAGQICPVVPVGLESRNDL